MNISKVYLDLLKLFRSDKYKSDFGLPGLADASQSWSFDVQLESSRACPLLMLGPRRDRSVAWEPNLVYHQSKLAVSFVEVNL